MAERLCVEVKTNGGVEKALRILNKQRAKAGVVVRENRHVTGTQKRALAKKQAKKRLLKSMSIKKRAAAQARSPYK